MRKLLLVTLMGMGLSRLYFGSFAPPELKVKAPGFDVLKGEASGPKPRWLTHPAHLHPAWMQSHRD